MTFLAFVKHREFSTFPFISTSIYVIYLLYLCDIMFILQILTHSIYKLHTNEYLCL